MSAETAQLLRTHPWQEVVARFREAETALPPGDFSTALGSVAKLAAVIADGPLSAALFGWTSMFDLCIQQTDAVPLTGPYLRVSPLPSGSVEFRYFDTAVQARQWHREVPPDAVTARFRSFLEQLRWSVGSATCSS